MNALLSTASSLPSGEIAVLIWAIIGGVFVFFGLAVEKFADWMNDRYLGGADKPHKPLETIGWCILMLGIFVEIAVAGVSANDAWETRQVAIKNDPNNLPIALVSAHAVVIVRSTAQSGFNNRPRVIGGPNSGLTLIDRGNSGGGGSIVLGLGQYRQFKTNRWHAIMMVPEGRLNSVNPDGSGHLRFDLSFGQQDVVVWNPNSLTSHELDTVYVVVPVDWDTFEQPLEVVTGGLTMTVNSSINREFSIPAQTNQHGFATSVNSNGVFIPLNIQ